MTALSGWAGTGAGLIAIGICVIAYGFVHMLPKFSHPWVHRALIILMYCGATAVLVTPVGQFIVRLENDVLNWFGGVGTGIGHVAIVLAGVFLLLTVLLALVKLPVPGAGYLAVALVFLLVLVPGGFLHGFLTGTAQPGVQAASAVSAWIGG